MSIMKQRARANQHGFSLVWVAAAIAILSVAILGVLPGGDKGGDAEKIRITKERMAAIEEATKGFMAAKLRRPCPADNSLATSNSDFGAEADNKGTCIGGALAANFANTATVSSSTTNGSATVTVVSGTTSGLSAGMAISGTGILAGTHIVSITDSTSFIIDRAATATNNPISLTVSNVAAGGVPVRSLGLADEYALDGWGQRFTYLVDQRVTSAANSTVFSNAPATCYDVQNKDAKGAINILSAYNGSTSKDNVMWAIVSHGPDGNGSFASSGNATRAYTATTDGNTSMNAFWAYSGGNSSNSNSFGANLVQKESSATFDDIVWYAEATKNTCCLGSTCKAGTSISNITATTAMAPTALGNILATGDVNGDGVKDFIMGLNNNATSIGYNSKIYVVFGKPTGWPISMPINIEALDGTNGFIINESTYCNATTGCIVRTIATGDLNGDGYDEIAISFTRSSASFQIAIIFGKSSFSSSISIGNLAAPAGAPSGSAGIVIKTVSSGSVSPAGMAIGKIHDYNTDGYKGCAKCKDLIWTAGSTQHWIFAIYGRSDWTSWAAPITYAAGNGAGTPSSASLPNTYYNVGLGDGFKIATSDSTNYPIGQPQTGLYALDVGNVNGDAYDDIVAVSATAPNNTNVGQAYVIFGKANWTADIAYSTAATNAPCTTAYYCANIVTLLSDAAKAVLFTATSSSYLGANVNIADMNNDGYEDILLGESTHLYGYNGKTGAWAATNLASSATFTIDTTTNRPAWITASPMPYYVTVGDLNGDGKKDLLLGTPNSTTPAACSKHANTGSDYVLFQPSGGWSGAYTMFQSTASASCDSTEMNMSGFRFDGTSASGGSTSDYAYIATIADYDNDGRNDIFVGAPGFYYNGGSAYYGAVFGLWGRQTWDSYIDTTAIPSVSYAIENAGGGGGGGGGAFE